MSPDDLVNKNIKLVSLPAVIQRVNTLLNEPGSSAVDIAECIGQDPALTVRLLKFVNSPFYNFPSKIETLSMAVTVLGTRQLRDLVFASTIVNRFSKGIDKEFDVEAFWCHSITAGLAARAIALDKDIPNSERLFIGGLLHDIGVMAMYLLVPNESFKLKRACRKKKVSYNGLEKEIFGFTHEELGHALLKAWYFPKSIYEPILHHHDLTCEDDFKTDTCILHVANVIANNIQAPVSKVDDTILDQGALELLNLDQATIERYYGKVYSMLDELLELLYYDLAA